MGRALAGVLGFGGLFGFSWLLLDYLAGERAGLLEDDSYFYVQAAFNAQGIGVFSFDGVNPTGGFHMLWGGQLALD